VRWPPAFTIGRLSSNTHRHRFPRRHTNNRRGQLRVLVLISSLYLSACSSLFFHPKGADPAKRWSLVQADAMCSTEIERKRWGSLLAMFTYKQRERDHGYAACVANKLSDSAEAK
jgi:hypothetical protein